MFPMKSLRQSTQEKSPKHFASTSVDTLGQSDLLKATVLQNVINSIKTIL